VWKVYYGKKRLHRQCDRAIKRAHVVSTHPFRARGLYADGDTVVELFKASATVKDAKPYNKSQLFEREFTG